MILHVFCTVDALLSAKQQWQSTEKSPTGFSLSESLGSLSWCTNSWGFGVSCYLHVGSDATTQENKNQHYRLLFISANHSSDKQVTVDKVSNFSILVYVVNFSTVGPKKVHRVENCGSCCRLTYMPFLLFNQYQFTVMLTDCRIDWLS